MPLTNPFTGPNRVPPPATRTLQPGTAQPYYPGDPVPNSPAIGVPAPVTPPGTTYGPQPSYSPPPTAPATPTNLPGGWNNYQPAGPVSSAPSSNWSDGLQQANATIRLGPTTGESIQVPTDNAGLRFAQASQFNPGPTETQPQVVPPQPNEQFQNLHLAQANSSLQSPVTPTQFVQQGPAAEPRQVVIREVSSSALSNYDDSASPTRRIGRDGFRPQGSSRSARDQARVAVRPTERTPSEIGFGPVQETADRFGFDPQYTHLRGKLEFSPTSGQWKLRYIPLQGAPDQLGGSVTIANPHVLGNLQPGEHVSVQGRLDMIQLDAQSIVPTYTISVLQRQQHELR